VHRGVGDIETDYLNGEIVLLGRIHGLPTPANELLQRLARDLIDHRQAPGELSSDAVLELLEVTEGSQAAGP
jgi:2-dehydropantoate 2-reductase